MQDKAIRIEVIGINGGRNCCKGRAKTCLGRTFRLHVHTPEGLCARSFNVIYPHAFAMRYAEKIGLETGGPFIDLACPDGDVTFRISREEG